MLIETLAVGPLQVNCFIVGCPKTRRAAVIDPGEEGERILAAAEAASLRIELIVNTHGHFDHVGANGAVVERTGAEIALHQADLPLLRRAREHAAFFGLAAAPSPEPTRLLQGGEFLTFGEVTLQVIHLPGHSPGGICLRAADHLFSGDALFAGSIGRTDLPGGDHELLIRGLCEKLLILPEETVVHPGHGPDTTIGREKRANPFLR